MTLPLFRIDLLRILAPPNLRSPFHVVLATSAVLSHFG